MIPKYYICHEQGSTLNGGIKPGFSRMVFCSMNPYFYLLHFNCFRAYFNISIKKITLSSLILSRSVFSQ